MLSKRVRKSIELSRCAPFPIGTKYVLRLLGHSMQLISCDEGRVNREMVVMRDAIPQLIYGEPLRESFVHRSKQSISATSSVLRQHSDMTSANTPKTVRSSSRPTEISVMKNRLRPDYSGVAGHSNDEQWIQRPK
jgi:hypothetical protein